MSAQPKPTERPDLYRGTSFLVDEILLSMADLATKVCSLTQGNASGSAVQQKLAAEQAGKIAGQIKVMAETIARVTVGHINRRSRP